MAEMGLETRDPSLKKIKVNTSGQCIPTRMAIIKTCKTVSVGDDIEKLKPLCIAGPEWCGCYET